MRLNQRPSFYLIAACIIGVGLVLRVFHLGTQELWFDEGVSFHIATTPGWLESMSLSPHPPLYYLLLRWWVSFAGSSEFLLRLPSAVFATLFIAATVGCGKRILDPAAGLWAGAFVALAPMHVYYAQEARSYALLALLLSLTYVATWRAVEHNTVGAWGILLLSQAATLATHYFAVFALIPTAFLLLLRPGLPNARSVWLRFIAVSATSSVFLTGYMFWNDALGFHSSHAATWITNLWRLDTPAQMVFRGLEAWVLGPHSELLPIFLKQVSEIQTPAAMRVMGAGAAIVLAFIVLLPWGERNLDIPFLRARKWWIIGLAVFPLAGLWLCSVFYKPVYVPGRYDIIAFPALALLLGLGLRKLQCLQRGGIAIAFVLLLILGVVHSRKLYAYYQGIPSNKGRLSARELDRHARDGDLVLFEGFSGIAGIYPGIDVLYQLHQLGFRDGHCAEIGGRSFDCRRLARATSDGGGLDAALAILPVSTDFGRLASEHSRIWLVARRRGDIDTHPLLTPLEADLHSTLTSRGFSARYSRTAPWLILYTRAKAR